MAKRYILELSEEQAYIIEQACELLSRLHIGQFNRITELLLDVRRGKGDYCERREAANEALSLASKIIYGRNLYNQPDCKSGIEHHRAWDVYQVLRHTRSWHENPQGGSTVNFYTPMSLIGEPLPKCKIIDTEREGEKE